MQQKKPQQSNAARSAMMRAKLIEAARPLFVQKGYAETSTPEIVRAAEVTRGALYHHFEDKAALFRAIVEQEAAEVAAAIGAAAPAGGDAADMLKKGAHAYFDAMTVPGRVRLLLLDGPAVLGPGTLKQILAAHEGAELSAGLSAVLAGRDAPVEALADIVGAAFDRAALAIAEGADAQPYRDAIDMLLSALAAPSG